MCLLLVQFSLNFASGLTWNTCGFIGQPPCPSTNTDFDFAPSTAQDSLNNVWVGWTSVPIEGDTEVLVKRMPPQQTGWIDETVVGQASGDDSGPDIARLNNGTMMVAWSRRTVDSDLYYRTKTGAVWFNEVRATQGSANDTSPSIIQDREGQIWLVWERQEGGGYADLYYKVLNGTVWSSEVQLTTDPESDISPSITETKDGQIRVAWASGRLGQLDIFYKTYNGTAWSADTLLTVDPAALSDSNPEIVQDRNGTIWVFWSRAFQNAQPGPGFQDDILAVRSIDNGQTWLSWETLTSTPDRQESGLAAGQFNDRRLWLFWSELVLGGTASQVDLQYMRSEPISTHDVTVVSVSNPGGALWNKTVSVMVTVTNKGDFAEVADITLDVGPSQFVSNGVFVSPGQTVAVPITWRADTPDPGRYTLRASATIVIEPLGNQADNTMLDGTMLIGPPGDFDLDGDVDIIDASRLAIAFDSVPASPNWDAAADLNGNNMVDILDASLLAFWFDTVL